MQCRVFALFALRLFAVKKLRPGENVHTGFRIGGDPKAVPGEHPDVRRAEQLKKTVDSADLLESLRAAAVVHGDDDPGLHGVGNALGLCGVNGIIPADGDEQHIDAAKLLKLRARQFMAKIAEVREAYALGGDDGDEVPAAKLAVLAVVKGLDLAQLHFGLVPRKDDPIRGAVVAVPMAAYYRVSRQLRQLKPRDGAGGIGVEDHSPILAGDLKA